MENLINRGQLKKELFTFLAITFIATYLLQFYIYHIAVTYPLHDQLYGVPPWQ
ncbi:hypothetical protein [uncultured Methanobacterium sp.]|uniref:hypothetical protein n=1 Tax=uncultured Methanobacterium sp. TaxID=176306 RepID=UPI002AA78DF1|nr:hypothetical protein [uncultured Methanobacterium sp.]